MKKIITTIAVFSSLGLYAQNNVGIGTLTPNPNAKLEIQSDDKGVLITRLTTVARNTLGTVLTAAEDGMLVYDKDLTAFYYWDGPGLAWVVVGNGSGSDDQNIDNFSFDNTTNILTIQIEDGNTQTVDLTSLLNDGDADPTNEIELPATAVTGQVLSWDGTNWVAQNAPSGADNWGTDVVNTTGTNISGDGTTASPLTVTDGDSDATNEIELPTGGTNGQVLSTDGSGVYTWINDNGGTDDQNIANLAFNSTTNVLTVGIEGGTSQDIDLTPLVNDADSDVTNEIQDLSINTTTNILTITNNGSATNIDLSSYLDNTDNQDLSLTGNTLSLTNDGTTVDLSGYMDNTDTQNISGSGLSGTTLTIGIQNGTNETVDLSSLTDADWYKVGGTTAPTNINDNIFTQGNVGIGTTTPSSNLEIETNNSGAVSPLILHQASPSDLDITNQIFIDFKFTDSNTNGTPQAQIGAIASTNNSLGAGQQAEGTADLVFKTALPVDIFSNNMTEKMRVTSNGNVGIGTPSPLSNLEVRGSSTQNALTIQKNFSGLSNSNAAFIGGTDAGFTNTGIYVLQKDNASFVGPNTNTFNVVNNSISQFVVKGAGNVGIETLNPITKLQVNGDVRVGLVNPPNTGVVPNYGNKVHFSGGPGLAVYDSDNSDPLWMARYNTLNDKSELRVNIGDNSQVDDAFSIGYTNGGGYNERFRFDMTGVARKPGGGTWTATSDRRTKKDIVNFSDGLNVLSQINPVTFKYNGLYNTTDDGKDYVGIIAQEVKPVAPYMIGSYEAPKTVESKSKEEILNYDGGTYMLYVLVNSVKEQQEQIEELKKELEQERETNKKILEKIDLLLK